MESLEDSPMPSAYSIANILAPKHEPPSTPVSFLTHLFRFELFLKGFRPESRSFPVCSLVSEEIRGRDIEKRDEKTGE